MSSQILQKSHVFPLKKNINLKEKTWKINQCPPVYKAPKNNSCREI